MTWIVPSGIRSDYVAASACLTSPCNSDASNSESNVTLRLYASGILTPRPSCYHAWKTRAWSRALFGAAIFATSTPSRFAEWWTSSLRASRASRTASPESNLATPTIAATATTETDQSRNFCESWPSVAPPWCSAKTCLPGFDEDSFDQSAKSYAAWVTRSKTRSLSLRKWLEVRASGNASLFSEGRLVMVWDASVECQQEPMIGVVIYENGDSVDVEDANGITDCFPVEWIRRVPRPQAKDELSDAGYNHGGKLQTPQLRHVTYGHLTSGFACWLMGVPAWWAVATPMAYAAREMRSYRSKLRLLLSSLCGE